jgi:protein-S-isoprenylcysteine O-methyltransferase Ste14
MSFFGVGPKIGVILLPWLAASIIISSITKGIFAFSNANSNVVLICGIILMIPALAFYFSTVKVLLKGLNETKLMTKGAFGLCQNPLYASICLFIIPALSLILNSWLVLTTSVVGYILFKIYIKSEYIELEKFFGREYLDYKARTPEFFPFPKKKSTSANK